MVDLDITKEHCPMTFVKVKLALAGMQSGDELDVLLTKGEPLENVPRTAEEEGHTVLSVEPEGEFYKIRIKKR